MSLYIHLKWISVSFTVLYVILAVSDLAVSVSWYLHTEGVNTGLADNWLHFNRVLAALVGLGFFLAIVGLLGCVAALKDALGLMVFSTVGVLGTACGFVAVAVFLGTRMAAAEVGVRNIMMNHMQTYNSSNNYNGTVSFSWDLTQQRYNCCGIDSASDWETSMNAYQRIPPSCFPKDSAVEHTTGCLFHSMIPAEKAVEGGLISTAVMASILFFGFFFNVLHCCLLQRTREKEI